MKGEMHLEMNGLGGWDYATRTCDPIVYADGTPVWVTREFNAQVVSTAARIGKTPKHDVLEIYLDPEKSDERIPENADDATIDSYLRCLSARGWKFHKFPK